MTAAAHIRAQTSAVELLSELSERIVLGASLDASLAYIYDAFTLVLPYDCIGFAEVDADTQTVHARWLRSRRQTVLGASYAAPLAGSSLALILEHRLPRVLSDLPAYLERHPTSQSTRLITQEGMKSSMTCPLFVGGHPYGFLFFSSTMVDAYQDAHVTVLKAISNQLALLLMASHAEPHGAHAAVVPSPAAPASSTRSAAAVAAPERREHAHVVTHLSPLLSSELTPGMVVGAPVVLVNGRVLVSAGVLLTDQVIARVRALQSQGFVRERHVHVRA